MAADKKTQALVDEIFKRIEDLSEGDGSQLTTAVSLVALKLLNKNHPPVLSQENKELIKENYPDATLQDMKNRGLSEVGLVNALAIFNHISIIAIDYSPLTNARADQRQDLALESKRATAQKIAENAFAEILGIGYTPYGTAATMIMMATIIGLHTDLSPYKLSRCLLEAMSKVLEAFKAGGASRAEVEEEILQALCEQMGISRATAKKYMKAALAAQARGDV